MPPKTPIAKLADGKNKATNPAAVTILSTKQLLTKQIDLDSEKTTPYSNASKFTQRQVACLDIYELAKLLKKLAYDKHSCIVNGQPIPEWQKNEYRRRRISNRKDGTGTLQNRVTEFLSLDIDGVDIGQFDPNNCDMEKVISNVLQSCNLGWMDGYSCAWAWTSSVLAPGWDGKVRIRLWFHLSRAVHLDQLKAWAKTMDKQIDNSIYTAVQPIYTAAPKFMKNGKQVEDPILIRNGIIEGMFDDRIPIDELLKAKPEKKKEIPQCEDQRINKLIESGLYIRDLKQGKHAVHCPWSEEHSCESGESSTVYLEPNYNGYDKGGFKCMHDSHRDRNIGDLDTYLIDPNEEFDDLTLESQISTRRTSLPLVVGSAGFDQQLEYVIKDYLPTNCLASIYGASGSYKSFLVLSWACHIASGKPWNGRSIKKGAVLYVVGEGGIGAPRRLYAWQKNYNGGNPLPNLYRVDCPVYPSETEQIKELCLAVLDIEEETGEKVQLIIFDTLARCFGGADENSSGDMGKFIRGCDRVREQTGAAVLIVHHTGKNENNGARGSSAFRAAVDAEFLIKREGKRKALSLTCTKMKDAEEVETQAFDLIQVDVVIDQDNEMITSLVVNPEGRDPDDETSAPLVSNKTVLIDILLELGEDTIDEVTRKALKTTALSRGMNDSTFRANLKRLKDEGEIKIEDDRVTLLRTTNEIDTDQEEF